jgi:hypothetical protein
MSEPVCPGGVARIERSEIRVPRREAGRLAPDFAALNPGCQDHPRHLGEWFSEHANGGLQKYRR